MDSKQKLRLLVITLLAFIVAGGTIYEIVQPWTGHGSAPTAVSPPANGSMPKWPIPGAGKAFTPDTQELRTQLGSMRETLPTDRPTGRMYCKPTSLAGSTGTWVASWLDDSTKPDVIPALARKLDVLDFFWLTLGDKPDSITGPPASSSIRSLNTVLASAQAANPCGLRFVTIVDDQDATKPEMIDMARILTDPKIRAEHVLAVAKLMASLPNADGLTVDYEYTVPQNEADLRMVAQATGMGKLSDAWVIDKLTRGMDQLQYDLQAAMSAQNRFLRDSVPVRIDSQPDNTSLPAYFQDYSWLLQCDDQVVLMTVDYHWDTGNPGPISPVNWVIQAMNFALSQRPDAQTPSQSASKLAAELPAYYVDWPVKSSNHSKGAGTASYGQASNLGNWPKTSVFDGEIEYTYTQGGQTHQVWDPIPGLAYKYEQTKTHIPGAGVMAFSTGNTDPVGAAQIINALGN